MTTTELVPLPGVAATAGEPAVRVRGQQPSLLFLMFLAYPLVWFVVDSVRAGVVWTLALAVAAAARPPVARR
jgi:hypothetical protein